MKTRRQYQCKQMPRHWVWRCRGVHWLAECRYGAGLFQDSKEMTHLQDDNVRVPKAVKEGFEDKLVVISNAVVRKLVPGIASLCDWLCELPMMKV